MKHFRRISLALFMFVLVVPIGVVSGLAKTLSGALDVLIEAIVGGLNALCADEEMKAALDFIATHKDPGEDE